MAKTSNKLTNSDLKNLAVGQAAYGSNLRATRNKSGITFHACFTIDGKRHLHRLGNNKNLSLTDAIRAAAEYRVKQEREHELQRVRIPMHSPTHSDRIRPPGPKYSPTCDAMP